MTPKHSIRRIGSVRCTVGEGPLWDVEQQALYFVDLVGRALWRYTPGSADMRNWPLPSMVGSVAIRSDGNAVVALQDGLYALDLQDGELSKLVDPQPPGDLTQCNDGKVDRRGRFLVGTQPRSLQDARPLGNLYAFEADGSTRLLDAGFQISNGPCWSPDSRFFYLADSRLNQIFVYDYDLERGSVSHRRPFANTLEFGGFPDGATVDADGNLWVAVCLAGKIVCYRPDATVAQVIDVPVRGVASVMFGGRHLDELFFTSIGNPLLNLPEDDLSGGLFVITGLQAQGLPERRFGG